MHSISNGNTSSHAVPKISLWLAIVNTMGEVRHNLYRLALDMTFHLVFLNCNYVTTSSSCLLSSFVVAAWYALYNKICV